MYTRNIISEWGPCVSVSHSPWQLKICNRTSNSFAITTSIAPSTGHLLCIVLTIHVKTLEFLSEQLGLSLSCNTRTILKYIAFTFSSWREIPAKILHFYAICLFGCIWILRTVLLKNTFKLKRNPRKHFAFGCISILTIVLLKNTSEFLHFFAHYIHLK